MGINGPMMGIKPPIGKPTFNYKKILKQKIINQPQPRYIRDSMYCKDIENGENMGEWTPP